MIQRSSTLSQMKINATLFKAFWCLEQGKLIKREYLSLEWLNTWCDFKRIGLRQGLYNTNNTSEAWFKSLLRVYLGGHSYSIFESYRHHTQSFRGDRHPLRSKWANKIEPLLEVN